MWTVIEKKDISEGSLAAIFDRTAAWSELDVLSQQNRPPALDRCYAVDFFSSRISEISALTTVTSIYPILEDIYLFVSSSGDNISLRSLANGKPYSDTHQQQV